MLVTGLLAQQSLTVEQVVAFVRSSLKSFPDKQIALQLSKMRLTQKLEDRVIEDLQGEGAGPKTVAALKSLADTSVNLQPPPIVKAAPPPPEIPPPPYEEQEAILREIREYALNYSKTLPDFICTQVTRRYVNRNSSGGWSLSDTIMAKLSYFEQKEQYKLLSVGDRSVAEQSYASVGGAISSGEFGSMLRAIFEERSHTDFHWARWATLRGKRNYVFAYRVEQKYSDWSVDYDHKEQINPAYQGLIFVDKATHKILRLTLEAVDMPVMFPIQEAKTRLDYDYTIIGNTEFLLPLVAQVNMRAGAMKTKNDVEFRLYRKFGTETNIKFDETPAPLDDTKTNEEPVSPDAGRQEPIKQDKIK